MGDNTRNLSTLRIQNVLSAQDQCVQTSHQNSQHETEECHIRYTSIFCIYGSSWQVISGFLRISELVHSPNAHLVPAWPCARSLQQYQHWPLGVIHQQQTRHGWHLAVINITWFSRFNAIFSSFLGTITMHFRLPNCQHRAALLLDISCLQFGS